MSPGARKAGLALGAAGVAVVALLLTSGGDRAYYVRAELRDAGGLRKNSSVKVAGVPAGKVTGLSVTRDDHAIAMLKIDKNAAPIGRDATLAVRPTDLLGERYAEVTPGAASSPLPKGGLIPAQRTSTPVELDDILNTLDPDTRARLGILVNEAGVGLDGRGGDLAKLLATLPPSLGQTRRLIDQVATQNVALRRLIAAGDRITASVNGRRGDMGDLIDQAAGALSTVAEKRRELGTTIRNAPGALAQLRSTLGRLDAASVQLRPAAVELQRTAAPLNGTLEALPRFADDAGPTLQKATEIAPQLTRLGRTATPTVTRLASSADLLKRTLDPAGPVLDHLDKRGTDDLLYFINNVNRGLQGRDGVGHFIGAKIYVNEEMLANAINAFNGYHPPAERKKGQTKPGVDLPKVTVPKVTLPDNVKKLVPDVHPRLPKAPNLPPPVAGAVPDVPPVPTPGGGGDALRLFDYLMGSS